MEVDFAFLADAAEAVNGKVHVVGGAFDTIWTAQVPINHPKLSFVLRLEFDAAEMGVKHKLDIRIMDEDGNNVQTIGGEITVGEKSPQLPKGWRQGWLTVLNFANLKFSKFGDYSFNVVINNSNRKSVHLRIAQAVQIQS